MSRLVSELGADVIDDTPQKPRKISPRKRNYIVGLSALGVGVIALGLVYYFATTNWLSDYQNMKYISYSINSSPDEDGPFKGQVTATIDSVDAESGYPSDFLIPTKINGHIITRIEDTAFQGCSRLTKIRMPNTITSIGEKAFINCKKLKTISFSKNITSIGNSAFDGTLYKENWKNDDVTYVNNILLAINEDKILSEYGASSIVLVANAESQYISQYSDSLVFSLDTFSVLNQASTNTAEKHITQWMEGSFKNFESLKFVEVPSYLSTLPSNSFQGCINLEKVVFSNGNKMIGDYAFDGCTNLNHVIFVNSISDIGDYAFRNNENLLINSLHDGVKTIGDGIFEGCEKITTFTIPASISRISKAAFRDTSIDTISFASNGSYIVDIDDYAFTNTKFQTFRFPKGVSIISDHVLSGCENLTTVYMYDDGPTRIDGHTFYNSVNFRSLKLLGNDDVILDKCSDDDTVYFPSTVHGTKDSSDQTNGYQFANTKIKHVVFNAALNNLGTNLFENCALLEDAIFEEGSLLRSLDNSVFKGCVLLEEFNFPKFVRNTGVGVFEGCTSLKTVTLPDSETWTKEDIAYVSDNGTITIKYYSTVKENMFSGCTSLESIILPKSVTKISEGSFRNCTSLKYITIPKQLTNIAKNAFVGCENLYVSIENSFIPETFVSNWNNGIRGYVLGSIGIHENEEYIYSLNNDGKSITIVDYIGSPVEDLVIPSSIDGKSVTSINNSFMRGNTTLRSVVLPDNLTSVGDLSFEDCPNLTFSKEEHGFRYLATSSNDYAFAFEFVPNEEKDYYLNENVRVVNYLALENEEISLLIDDGGYYFGSETNEHFLFVKVQNKVANLTINDETVIITENAVANDTDIKSVTIPESVQFINRAAFYKNNNLSIYCKVGSELATWDYCWNISGSNVYWLTKGPANVTNFNGCINIDDTVRLTSYTGKSSEIEVPSTIVVDDNEMNVTQIAAGFVSSSTITSVYIPSSITKIEAGAFKDCSSLVVYLEDASIPAGFIDGWKDEKTPVYFSVTKNNNHYSYGSIEYAVVGDKAVVSGHKYGIRSASIRSTVGDKPVETIGAFAFAGETSLTSVFVPDSVKSVEEGAFKGCTSATIYFAGEAPANIKEVTDRPVYENVTSDKLYAEDSVEYILNDDNTAMVTGFTSGLTILNIPETITVNEQAYTVTTIKEKAFEGCTPLVTVSFSSRLLTIEKEAFFGCTAISKAIVIPQNVTYIGDRAFGNTTTKVRFYVYPEVPPITWSSLWDFYDYGANGDIDDDDYDKIKVTYGYLVNWKFNDETGNPELIQTTTVDD